MKSSKQIILEVVLPTPVRKSFDYLPPTDWLVGSLLSPGCRVMVQFGTTTRIAMIVKIKHRSELDIQKIKHCIEIIDNKPLLDKKILKLAIWASNYYHHSLGEICFKILPILLRNKSNYQIKQQKFWKTTTITPAPETLSRSPKQRLCLQLLADSPLGLADVNLKTAGIKSEQLNKLQQQGWIEAYFLQRQAEKPSLAKAPPIKLTEEQKLVLQQCHLDSFNIHLLDGITGSGKTEIYLQLIEQKLAQSKQVLVLVPEIGLTPQLVKRFQQRLQIPIGLLHSGLNNQERLENWLMTVDGQYSVLIGTRSALFTPMKNLALIIIDEEHDPSFKQQQGWTYSARDLALVRARDLDIPIMLGTATPSLETLHHAMTGKYHHLKLRERPGSSSTTKFQVLDIRKLPIEHGVSKPLLDNIGKHLRDGNQVIIFINRRGYAPVLMCHDCGWMANCKRCESSYTLHQSPNHLHCHHCDGRRKIPECCPDCQSNKLTAVGVGTERVESLLSKKFPDFPLIRIDRDSTRRKDAMKNYIDDINNGHYKILIGTQMLSKGHHFPDVSLVAILDMDGALFSADFRAAEKFAQLLTQVAGRAGRADKPGTVMLQTHHPDHPQLQTLLTGGYLDFACQLIKERQQCMWPPFSYLAMFRAEALHADEPEKFLRQVANFARQQLTNDTPVSILGPISAPMPRRAGKYRCQLLLQASNRKSLQILLRQIIFYLEGKKIVKSVRWSLDVDPLEMF